LPQSFTIRQYLRKRKRSSAPVDIREEKRRRIDETAVLGGASVLPDAALKSDQEVEEKTENAVQAPEAEGVHMMDEDKKPVTTETKAQEADVPETRSPDEVVEELNRLTDEIELAEEQQGQFSFPFPYLISH
jgi:hypothetical protein